MTSSSGGLRLDRAVGRALVYLLLAATAAAVVLPLLIVAGSSLKGEMEIFEAPFRFFPREAILDNYAALRANFPLYILNSAKLTTIIVLVQAFTATTGAYAFAKLNFRGRDALFMLYIASVMVPVQAIIIPQFIVVKNLGLYDSHWAIVAVSVFTAFGTFLVKQFFMTVPQSFVEAARIDGATEGQIYRRVMLPLSKPVLATLVIFSFRFFWNDFFTPLIYLSKPSLKTLPLGMADFASQYNVLYGPQMAASFISIIPVLVIFALAQKHFVQGAMSSGVKG
jgi:multiple sugar transport system permease protein